MPIGDAPISMATAPMGISGRQWRHFRGSNGHWRLEMLFAATEMRFGQPAISTAISPMDIGTGRMGFSVTESSIAKAPMAMAVPR